MAWFTSFIAGVGPAECHVSPGWGSAQRARWRLISLSPGLHELRRANERALSPALGWIVGQVGRRISGLQEPSQERRREASLSP